MYALVSLERLSLHVVGVGFTSSAGLTKYLEHRGSWWYLWNEWIYTALIFFFPENTVIEKFPYCGYIFKYVHISLKQES